MKKCSLLKIQGIIMKAFVNMIEVLIIMNFYMIPMMTYSKKLKFLEWKNLK